MSALTEILGDSPLTEEMILSDYEDLVEYYAAMEVPCRLIPATNELIMPTVVAINQLDDEEPPFVITHSFIPLDSEEAEFTKFLQFYMELQQSLEGIDRVTLLEAVNRLNLVLPLGACMLVAARPELKLPEMVAIRMIQGYPISESIDQGVFTEQLYMYEISANLILMVFDELLDGKSLDEAFATIGR